MDFYAQSQRKRKREVMKVEKWSKEELRNTPNTSTASKNKKRKNKKMKNVNADEKKNDKFAELTFTSGELERISEETEERAKSMKRLAKKMRIKFRVLDSKLPTTMAKHFREFSKDLDLHGKISVDVKKKSRCLKQQANKLQIRLTALQNLVEQGLDEKMLWDLDWATDLEANQALMVMANLRLSDEASAIANQHKLLLEEPGQSQLCKEIPLNTMTKAYKKTRDYIVRKSATPNKYLKKTQPYISYRRSLENGLEVLQQNASNFAAEARKHFEMVMVRDQSELERMKAEATETKPRLVIPALPESTEVLHEAITQGFTVLLF